MTRCPACLHTLAASAQVAAFLSGPDWTAFYGTPGSRFIRCRGTDRHAGRYVHFIVRDGGGDESHRLAYGIQSVTDAPSQMSLFEEAR